MDDRQAPTPRARRFPKPLYYYASLALLGLVIAAVLGGALVALALTPTLPDVEALTDKQLKVPMRVYTQDGVLIGEFGEEKRIPVKRSEVPDQLVKAILAAEDDSFYYHGGVDFLGIVRAALANLRSGTPAEGASTITMQVARNYFLTPEKTYTRKLREVLLAFKLEREFSKDEILELYLNKIFLGNRAYGFAAAAQIYYGKSLNELTLPEIAMLAGLPKAPSRDNPISNPDNARDRRNYVLGRMLKLDFIDDAEHAAAREAPVTAGKQPFRYTVDAPYVAEMVRQYMFETYSEKTYANGFHVYTTISTKHQQAADRALRAGLLAYDQRHGYRGPAGHETIDGEGDRLHLDDILKDYQAVAHLLPAIVVGVQDQSVQVYTQDGQTTNIDWSGLAWARRYLDENSTGPEPKTAGEILRVGDIVYVAAEKDGLRLAQPPTVAGALVSLRANDGAILALTGGFDFYQSKFNRVVQAERQPGSSLKPFIYSAALEKGFTPASLVSGAPIVMEDVNLEDEWRPENYSGKFYGPTRLRKALALSLNLVSVRVLRALGPDFAIQHLAKFGFDPKRLPRNLSLALGTASVTPLQMGSAFAVFANGGYKVEPYLISRIEDGHHQVLERFEPVAVCQECEDAAAVLPAGAGSTPPRRAAPRAISAANAFLTTSMLQDVIAAGTGKYAQQLGRSDLAGKTGTTNEHRDAWFCGFTPELVTVAWVGFDQNQPLGNGEAGGSTALPIWVDYMRTALEGVAEKPWRAPPGVVTATIDSETGQPTSAASALAMQEYFMEGTIPRFADVATDGEAAPAAPIPEGVREGLF